MTKRWIKSTVLEHSQHPRVDFGITTPSWVHAQSVEFQRTDDGAARLLERMPQRHQPPAIGAQCIYVDLEDRRHIVGSLRNLDGAVRRLLAKDHSAPGNHDIAPGRYPNAPI